MQSFFGHFPASEFFNSHAWLCQLRIGFMQYCRGDRAPQSARDCSEWAALPASFDIKHCRRPGYGVCLEIFVCRASTSTCSICEPENRTLDIVADSLLPRSNRDGIVVGISAWPSIYASSDVVDMDGAMHRGCSADFARTV